MSVVLGKNVFIYSGSTGTTALIAAAKSCSVAITGELLEKASSTQSTAKEFIAGRTEWEVTMNHLVTAGAPFEGLLKVNQTVTLSVLIGTTRMTGTAICLQASLDASVGSIAHGTVKFKGSGPLSQ